jgi:hypothetical protein
MVPFSKGEANTRAHGSTQEWRTELMTLDFEKRRKSGVPYGYLKYGAKANTSAHGLNEAWITELMTLDFEKKQKKKVERGSMLVRSDRRSSIDLPQKQQQRDNRHQGSTLET